MLKIGSLNLPSKILCAPLAGVSDSAYRMICREHGALFTFIEMINVRAISHKNKKTKKMLSASPLDRPLGIQLLGCEETFVIKAIEVVQGVDHDLLDLNVACPVRKVCRRGEGAALAKEPSKLAAILRAIIKHSPKPLTIKLRSGWDEDSINAPEIAKLAQDCGVSGIFIHGRHRNQFYKGSVDYRVIERVKKNVSIPVVASGDIFTPLLAKKMFDETGCDGVLIARGALGNPWIFRSTEEYLRTGILLPEPEISEIVACVKRHMELAIEEHGEKKVIPVMRKFIGWYLKGKPFIRSLRQSISLIKTKTELLDLLGSL